MKKVGNFTEQELLEILQGVYEKGMNESATVDAKELVLEIAKNLQPYVMTNATTEKV
ncbi:hypothetical protein [Halalkalibacter nanhaiisediminis]|uniref:Uncharacterized protein n=1 Tax=Halalkalibacter nanhaiisediminis TaxID=688079 RepID=A0A562QT92_9BACI|nr:hypothetical protein [Halalkalibacter nanhaiisediminis]TWI59917.1 hypothetical protein IQ10_00340 [Halalkalibacter nanhaiisediminis]